MQQVLYEVCYDQRGSEMNNLSFVERVIMWLIILAGFYFVGSIGLEGWLK